MEKEKKRHSSSPGKNKHVSPKVVFVHNKEQKVEDTLRMKGMVSFYCRKFPVSIFVSSFYTKFN